MPKLTNEIWKLSDMGAIHNKNDCHAVGGNQSEVVVDATIQQGAERTLVRTIAPGILL